MYHVQTKLVAAVFLTAVTALVSCGDSEKKQAEALFIMAETAAQDGEYDKSIELIDSLDKVYTRQVETRRKAMHLRARAIEGSTVKAIADVSSLRAGLQIKGDSLQALLLKVDNPLEPYFVFSGQKRIVGETGIEARMSPDGMFYMISSLRNPKVNHTYITVSAAGESARTAEIAHDGERNDRSMGYEVIHYMMPECDSVGSFIATHTNSDITVTFGGTGKTHSFVLTPEQAEGIATLYRAAENAREQRRAAFEEARLERQLEIARTHAAKTYSDDTSQE